MPGQVPLQASNRARVPRVVAPRTAPPARRSRVAPARERV